MLRAGGSAADAAIATSAVLAVTTQHMCGMGGDLFALVHRPDGAAGRARAPPVAPARGSDAVALRAEGHRSMPFRGDVRSAPVPGCVDGWCALHERHGRLPLADGARAGAALRRRRVRGVAAARHGDRARRRRRRRRRLPAGRRPARQARASAGPAVAAGARAPSRHGGRDGVLRGPVRRRPPRARRRPVHARPTCARPRPTGSTPIGVEAWGHRIWTVPPPSQGYLTLSGGVDRRRAPRSPTTRPTAAWAHLLVEAARLGGLRPARRAARRRRRRGAAPRPSGCSRAATAIDPDARRSPDGADARPAARSTCAPTTPTAWACRSSSRTPPDWGCHVVVPATGIFLHNRGIGFSLEAGHPAELAPGRRPPHTLVPRSWSPTPTARWRAVLGTMGGDSQPQVLLQLLARLLLHGQSPGRAVSAPRWTLGRDGTASTRGRTPAPTTSRSRQGAPDRMGSRASPSAATPSARLPRGASVGHAHVIRVLPHGTYAGASDPRARSGAAVGL